MTRRKPIILPFNRPTPSGGSMRMVFPACSRATALTLEFVADGPLPHVIVERDGKPAPIKWTGHEVEPPSLVRLAPLTRRRERGPA